MPITKTMAYKAGEQTFPTLEEAQLHSLTLLFSEIKTEGACGPSCENIASFAMDHAEEIVDILDSDPESEKKPRKPRSDKGTKRIKEFTAVEVK